MRAILHRFADSPFGVFGWLDLLADDGTRLHRFATAEDDWLNNKPAESCIPWGTYDCVRSVFHRHDDMPTFEITKVPGGRERILFHPGNTEEDSMGCILVGFDFGALLVQDEDAPGSVKRTKWSVVESRAAFAEFMRLLQGVQTFKLEVLWAAPGSWR